MSLSSCSNTVSPHQKILIKNYSCAQIPYLVMEHSQQSFLCWNTVSCIGKSLSSVILILTYLILYWQVINSHSLTARTEWQKPLALSFFTELDSTCQCCTHRDSLHTSSSLPTSPFFFWRANCDRRREWKKDLPPENTAVVTSVGWCYNFSTYNTDPPSFLPYNPSAHSNLLFCPGWQKKTHGR